MHCDTLNKAKAAHDAAAVAWEATPTRERSRLRALHDAVERERIARAHRLAQRRMIARK